MSAHQLIIIGSGPAGYTAAIYAARDQLNPIVFAGEPSGGQLMLTTKVENFPGFDQGILGPKLMQIMRQQAVRFGTEIINKNVTRVDFTSHPFRVFVGAAEYMGEAVIIATGAEANLLGIPGESELMGRGVSTCAVCDAPFYKDKVTFVVGGGDTAMEEANALLKFTRSVTLVHRRDKFRAAKILQQRFIDGHSDKVSVLWNTELVKITGAQKVETISVKNNKTGEEKQLPSDGVFIAIGHKPSTEIFVDQLELDAQKYIITRLGLSQKGLTLANAHLDENKLIKFPTMTSVAGIFAAGDAVDFRYRQAVTAAGFGCMAALDAQKWLETKQV